MKTGGSRFKVATSKKQRKNARKLNIVFPEQDYRRMIAEFDRMQEHNLEGYAIAVCGIKSDTSPKRHNYLVKSLLMPDRKDMIDHSSVSVTPAGEFMEKALAEAADTNSAVLEIHTHLDTEKPSFSTVDVENGIENGRFLKMCKIRFAMMVMGSTGFAITEYDSDTDSLQMPDSASMEMMIATGKAPIIPESKDRQSVSLSKSVDRQLLLWGEKCQLKIENTIVGIAGLGGTGAALLQMLARIGVNKFVLCDPDIIEVSNLSRMPYAFEADINRKKVKVAAAYLKKINKGLELQAIPEKVQNAGDQLKRCDVLFGCVDNDGARLSLNELSLRYYIPYIDTGTEIFVNDSKEIDEIGGQIRIVVPTVTGCLACAEAIDFKKAAIGMMDQEDLKPALSAGYVYGTDLTPAPAVITLNTIIAGMAVQKFVDMAACNDHLTHNYLIYDSKTPLIERFSFEKNSLCPMCGKGGILGSGDVRGVIKKRSASGIKKAGKPDF